MACWRSASAARALPPPPGVRGPLDLLLDGLARLVTDGPAAAAATLRQAVNAFVAGDVSREEGLRWGWMAGAQPLWDDDAGHAIMARQVQLARAAGALAQLPSDLVALAMSTGLRGDFAAAASLIAETDAVCEVTGSRIAPYTRMFLASLRGNEAELASASQDEPSTRPTVGGQGAVVTYAHWATAILHNGLGRLRGRIHGGQASQPGPPLISSRRGRCRSSIEAAVRTSDTQVAADALEWLAETTQPCGTDWALGVEARCRAMLADGPPPTPCTARRSTG